jgi:hypothetical protein
MKSWAYDPWTATTEVARRPGQLYNLSNIFPGLPWKPNLVIEFQRVPVANDVDSACFLPVV